MIKHFSVVRSVGEDRVYHETDPYYLIHYPETVHQPTRVFDREGKVVLSFSGWGVPNYGWDDGLPSVSFSP